jgi:hypothetical protein
MGILDNLEAAWDRSCAVCNQPFNDETFWDTHQTMSDKKVWCAK